MNNLNNIDKAFLGKITGIVQDRLSNEMFGVSELATELGMSRSNLLRKVKRITGLSVSNFIRNMRLEAGRNLLLSGSMTVSEVAYRVGFGSTSYFVKCYHDHYGYPPGETAKNIDDKPAEAKKSRSKVVNIVIGIFISAALIISIVLVLSRSGSRTLKVEKSIAVLPFINDSHDSSNVYFVNGLMESILTNLQKIEDLRVVSRTSVEKYRTNQKSIDEISDDLNVKYIIEGSGQKSGNRVMLNIQLIDAETDTHIWSEQYSREMGDIFQMQIEVAKNIASNVQAVITPEESVRIGERPTDNIIAYDYFLKGMEEFHTETVEGLWKAIELFEKAIEYDNEFARAYADISLSYTLLEIYQAEKKYLDLVNEYADKALLYDPELSQSLAAKALYYMNTPKYEKALPYLEKALKYNPNSSLVLGVLSDYYTSYVPDSEKYLEYALMGTEIDIAGTDSIEASYLYLHIANSFLQTGFIDEAAEYVDISLKYFAGNMYSLYVREYIIYAEDGDLERLRRGLAGLLELDPLRIDVLQELAKVDYFLRDYESADSLFTRFLEIKEDQKLDVYNGEDAKIAFIYSKMDKNEPADKLTEKYGAFAMNDRSVYRNLNMSVYYCLTGDREKSIDYFRKFSKETRYNYLFIPLLKIDPLMDNILDHPEFDELMDQLESGFRDYHEEIRKRLKSKGLI